MGKIFFVRDSIFGPGGKADGGGGVWEEKSFHKTLSRKRIKADKQRGKGIYRAGPKKRGSGPVRPKDIKRKMEEG